jgi:hypothetical protein
LSISQVSVLLYRTMSICASGYPHPPCVLSIFLAYFSHSQSIRASLGRH